MQDEKRPVRELSAIREDIDKIDRELVSLFCKRMELSLDVAESKRNTGKAVFDPEREKLLLKKVSAHEKRPEREDPGEGKDVRYFTCKPAYQGNGEQDRKGETELRNARSNIPPDDQRDQIPADIVGLDQSEGSFLI